MAESFSLVVTSAPAAEPVTVAEAKAHCRVDHDDEDDLFSRWITAARQWCEAWTARRFVTQTLRMRLDGFPPDGVIRLKTGPVQSVSSVTYYDSAGTSQTLSSTYYVADTDADPARIWLASGSTWPVTYDRPGAVSVTYVAGYGAAAAVPAQVKQAILLIVEGWNDERGPDATVPTAQAMFAVKSLLTSVWSGEYAGVV